MEMQITLIEQHEERLLDLEAANFDTNKTTTIFEAIEDRCIKIDTSWRENFGKMNNKLLGFVTEMNDMKWHFNTLKEDLASSNAQIKI
jgi:hypothetical protein